MLKDSKDSGTFLLMKKRWVTRCFRIVKNCRKTFCLNTFISIQKLLKMPKHARFYCAFTCFAWETSYFTNYTEMLVGWLMCKSWHSFILFCQLSRWKWMRMVSKKAQIQALYAAWQAHMFQARLAEESTIIYSLVSLSFFLFTLLPHKCDVLTPVDLLVDTIS